MAGSKGNRNRMEMGKLHLLLPKTIITRWNIWHGVNCWRNELSLLLGERQNGHRGVSVKKKAKDLRRSFASGTWRGCEEIFLFLFFFFNLSKSQVFVYKREDKVGPLIDAFWSSVASWKEHKLWSLKDLSLNPLNCYVTLENSLTSEDFFSICVFETVTPCED